MKRNWDLLRWILNKAESTPSGYPIIVTKKAEYGVPHYLLDIGEYNFEEVYEHVLLLGDSDLAKVQDIGRTHAGPAGVAIERLTMAGHDFLDAARDESRWEKALTIVNEKGGGAITLGVLIQLLSVLMKQSFGLS